MTEERSMNGEANRQENDDSFNSDKHEDGGNSSELNRNQELELDNDEINRKIETQKSERSMNGESIRQENDIFDSDQHDDADEINLKIKDLESRNQELELDNDEINGTQDDDIFDSDKHKDGGNSTELNRKIKHLESRNQELEQDNEEINRKIETQTWEIEKLRGNKSKAMRKMCTIEREIEKLDEEKKVLEVIAAKASKFEREVTQLQREMVKSRTEHEEAVTDLKKIEYEISLKEKENEKVKKEIVTVRTDKEASEKRMWTLRMMISVLNGKEREERSEKIQADLEMRRKIHKEEKEIDSLKKKVKELEPNVEEWKEELQKWESKKMTMENVLRKSEKKVMAKESEIVELQKQIDDVEKMINGLKNMVELEVKSWSPTVTAGSSIVMVVVTVAGAAVLGYIYHSNRV